MAIECLVLGAGQEVGKSCVVVTINGKRIMFDCGMHMGYDDHRRYPDFSLISKSRDFDHSLDCVIITHFHLDHVGALPYFTEVCGYNGPIYMTYPTKALAPLMLEDFRKVLVDRRGEEEQFTSLHISQCMQKVIAIDLKQTLQVDDDLQIRAYYAGHVLGAAMFYAKVGESAMVYTGDYNMTPDRHLGAAQIDRLELDLLITESTYATTIRDSKYAREREFLKAVHECVAGGGKVLIPTFALGRAQELCILLDDYWERMNLKVPIYFSAGLTIQANMYYKILISWTSQKIKETYATRNAFDFKHVHNFDRSLINAPGPCVLFATPGMISGGFSLEVFKQWAPCEMNLITLPGYCVAGTVGHKLMSGKPTKIVLDKDTQIDVRCQIHQLSFSPHTDSKGIMDLARFLSPKNVILVHGEKPKMVSLKERIQSELRIPCYLPANYDTVHIPSTTYVKAHASNAFIRSCLNPNFRFLKRSKEENSDQVLRNTNSTAPLQVNDERVAEGILIMEKGKKARVVHQDDLLLMLRQKKHDIQFGYCCAAQLENLVETGNRDGALSHSDKCSCLQLLFKELSTYFSGVNIQDLGEHLQVESFQVSVCLKDNCPYRIIDSPRKEAATIFFCCSWSAADEKLAREIISAIERFNLSDNLPCKNSK
ncbi:INTEGRATOR COMPLEX SUBUNIT 11 [Salix koriyanagi]|uniref:INTEGRATOR COMPLEX SUBUNIT 11 n=1 Tax=Salix koriyanagi TaxID=2511006 RepID=A0A9Q0WTF3_9ROSI|nr:INTEGRATOR COMPLEX SUBUNIT 11 [Salix koriyanagi]